MSFDVGFSTEAEEDLERLFEFLLDRAETTEDLDAAQASLDSLRAVLLNQLSTTPFSFRKSAKSSTRRELVIPSGKTGYVALYEIASPSRVVVLAVRHQREEDFR
jgi:plasmid stabilization system protein ParE